ncbi:MAG: ABC transporter [Rhodobacteraceae bacterium]|nr:ABC transporter [Paracoccaceae bacterium]
MSVSLRSLSKRFGAHKALSDVSLEIETGSFFVILGPSGCGKSTLLRLIAGLETQDSGEIDIDGRRVAGAGFHVPPEDRDVGVVFQSYALWPHMSVEANVAFPVESAGLSARDRKSRVERSLETVGLDGFAKRKPASLSGGQRQRVALARCLAQAAGTVLMDEPLANLDPHLRQTMEEELAQFHRKTGATTLYITHDQREAMALADRIAILWEGRVLQADRPEDLYRRPASERVARFIGRAAIWDGMLDGVSGVNGTRRAEVRCGPFRFAAECAGTVGEGPARIVLRPEDVEIRTEPHAVPARVEAAVYRGGFWDAALAVEGVATPLVAHVRQRLTPGETVPVSLASGWVLPSE